LYLAARGLAGRDRTIALGASACFAGCALSVKWTGASALGVVLAAWFIDALMRRPPFRRFAVEGALLVAIPLVIYVGSFAIHFRLLDHSSADELFMSPLFGQSLIGSSDYNPTVHIRLWRELRDVHHAIRVGNESLEHARHIGASRWYTWPIMKHPMGLWEPTPEPPGQRGMIVLVGNPLVWWGGLAGVLLGVVGFVVRRNRFVGHEFGFLLLLGAALLNFVPFAAIRRLMYIYH